MKTKPAVHELFSKSMKLLHSRIKLSEKTGNPEKKLTLRSRIIRAVYAGFMLGETKSEEIRRVDPTDVVKRIRTIYGDEIGDRFDKWFNGWRESDSLATVSRVTIWRHLAKLPLVALRHLSADFRKQVSKLDITTAPVKRESLAITAVRFPWWPEQPPHVSTRSKWERSQWTALLSLL